MAGTNPMATYATSDYTVDTATAYKTKIDSNSIVAKRIVDCFAPRQTTVPAMTVTLDAGYVYTDTALVEVTAQTTGTITAPGGNPRIDRIVIDRFTGVVSVVTGTPAGSPVAPAIPTGKVPVAQVLIQTSSTTITNSMITDERSIYSLGRGLLGELGLVNSVTNAILAQMAANTVKGNNTNATANAADIALAVNQFLGRGASGNLAALGIDTTLLFTGTTLGVKSASSSQLGAVQPDGVTIDVIGGLLEVIGGFPAALSGSLNTSGDTVVTVDFTTYASYLFEIFAATTTGAGGSATALKIQVSTNGGSSYSDFILGSGTSQTVKFNVSNGGPNSYFMQVSQPVSNGNAMIQGHGQTGIQQGAQTLTDIFGETGAGIALSANINRIKIVGVSGVVSGGSYRLQPISKR